MQTVSINKVQRVTFPCGGHAYAQAGGSQIAVEESTMQKCWETGEIPCEGSMALITAYGRATKWKRLPLRPRNWFGCHPDEAACSRHEMGDFCIRRSQLASARPLLVQQCMDSKGSDNVCFSC